jgi:hypothetical protein
LAYFAPVHWHRNGLEQPEVIRLQLVVSCKRLLFLKMGTAEPHQVQPLRHVRNVQIDSIDCQTVHVALLNSKSRPIDDQSNRLRLVLGQKQSARLFVAILTQMLQLRFKFGQPEVDELHRFFTRHSQGSNEHEPLIRSDWWSPARHVDLCRVQMHAVANRTLPEVKCSCCEGARVVFSQVFAMSSQRLISLVFDDHDGLLLQAKQTVDQQVRVLEKWHLLRNPDSDQDGPAVKRRSECASVARLLIVRETKLKHTAGSDTMSCLERQSLCTCASPQHFSVLTKCSSMGTCTADALHTQVRFCVTGSDRGTSCELHVALHVHFRRWLLTRPSLELEIYERTLRVSVVLADLINHCVLVGRRPSSALTGTSIDLMRSNWTIESNKTRSDRSLSSRTIAKRSVRSTKVTSTARKAKSNRSNQLNQNNFTVGSSVTTSDVAANQLMSTELILFSLLLVIFLFIWQTVMYVRMQRLLQLMRM